MEKLRMKTNDLVDENIQKLKELFPNCVVESKDEQEKTVKKVDFELLKQELSKVLIDDNKERYQMIWPDKKQAVLNANSAINKTLRPCREESVDYENTQNIYIEGDNLDVLKVLRQTYMHKVKMIYIDPPYNTGNDFIYNDDFAKDREEYLEESGQVDEDGYRMVKNQESNGRFHTDWLNMIYPRLRVAKDLLTDDGVIFISIDDNEQANLKKVCDEIFGESNFVCCLNWNTKKAAQGMVTEHMIIDNHEYIFVYQRAKNFKFLGLVREESNGFSNPDNDPRGLWKRQYLQRIGQGLPNRMIIDPKTGNVFTFQTPYTQEKLDKWIKEDRIIFPTEINKYPARKEFLSEYTSLQQLVTSLGLYATKSTTEKVYSLFDGEKIFTNPKPQNLIQFLIKQATTKLNDIILDFFSGSATTAHAVMQLNAEDGGNRKFIMVQLPEKCDEKSEAYKAGYKNICEIGKERIRRAGKKIKEEHPNATCLDTGFRVFKLDSSNMKDCYYYPEKTTQDMLQDLQDNIKEDRTAEDLLIQVMLDMGVELSSKIETVEIEGKKVYKVNDNNLVCCFESNLTDEVVTEIAKIQPLYAVFRDSSMQSDSVNVNFEQLFNSYSPNTIRKVL